MTSKEGILGIVLPFIIKICAQCLQNRMRNLDYFTSCSPVPAGWQAAAVITFLTKGGLLTTLPLSKRTCDPCSPSTFPLPPQPHIARENMPVGPRLPYTIVCWTKYRQASPGRTSCTFTACFTYGLRPMTDTLLCQTWQWIPLKHWSLDCHSV